VLPGPTLAGHECRACLERLAACAGPGFVVASGGLPPGAPADFHAQASRIVTTARGRFLLDTSVPALNAALAEGVFLVEPSLRELRDAAGEPLDDEADWIRACAGLVKHGRAAIIALMLGSRGALLVAESRVLRAKPPPFTPVSSVGAGDSVLGGWCWGLAAGYDRDTRRLVDAVTVREM
jgi:6-phosphofructokinase 2